MSTVKYFVLKFVIRNHYQATSLFREPVPWPRQVSDADVSSVQKREGLEDAVKADVRVLDNNFFEILASVW